jgi:hypothetical protein
MKTPIYITAEPSTRFIQSIMEICAAHTIDVSCAKEAIEPRIMKGNTSAHFQYEATVWPLILGEARQALIWLLEEQMMLSEFPPDFAKDIQHALCSITEEWKLTLFFDVDFDLEYEMVGDNQELANKLATLLHLK